MSRRAKARRQPKAAKPAIGEHIEQQRRRLLAADAIVICVARALDSLQDPPDEIRIAEALQVASTMLNDVAEALERVKGDAS